METSIFCGDIINGTTNEDTRSIYYIFINNLTNAHETGVYVQFSTCGSSYDTQLHLYDSNWTEIAVCDSSFRDEDCTSCGDSNFSAQFITHTKLKDTVYFLGVTGRTLYDYGAFRLQTDCDFDYPVSYASSMETSIFCGDIINGATNQSTRSIGYTFINNLRGRSIKVVATACKKCDTKSD
eukprot:487346_1